MKACAHCGGPAQGTFCCTGCAAAHGLIESLGLGSYYRRRALDPTTRPPRPDGQVVSDPTPFVRADPDGTYRLDLMVDGLQCAACVWLIEHALAEVAVNVSARVNLTTRRLAVTWRGTVDEARALAGRVAALGYRVAPFDAGRLAAAEASESKRLLWAMAVAGFAAANVMLLSVAVWAGQATSMGPATRDLLHWFSALIALPAIGYAGRPFFASALGALRYRRTNMDVPISIGVLLATGMSLAETVNGGEHAYFDSACALLFFLLVGRFLDARARGRARAAAGHLAGLQARAVTRLRQADGLPEAVAPEAIAVGDRVLVTAGERIPVDGTVDGGRAMIDTSLVTGEAAPTSAGAGDRVFAGMMALDAPLTVRVDACGSATLLADIARMMEDAEQGRARYAALADRVARWYAPVVHCLALATLLVWMLMLDASWTTALPIAIAVLIITCPCALALAVPVVQVVASGRLFRAGVLLRSPTALERLADVDTIILDKTGTLTLGRPAPDLADLDPDDRAIAAGLAGASRHPLARALAAALPGAGPRLEAREVAGEGMETCEDDPVRLGRRSFCRVPEDPAVAEPELWLARPGRRARRIPFGDPLRADARATVERLRHLGLGVGLLSGDHAGAVGAVAAAVGIDRVRAEARPADKVASIRKLAGEGRRVLMVGDGLNDAPALAAAHVSLSPAAAADISRNAADAVFQGDALAPVAMVVDVARRARVLVRQNLALALAYNLVAVPLAMAGLVTPLLAAAAMSTSSILVIVNALRLGSVR